jgi:ABC-type amino acid transport substrate-binding protein
MSRLNLHRLHTLLCGVILAWLLAGCGEEPRLPRLVSFTPAVLTVPANQTLAVSVEYEEHDFALDDFQWRADAGAIEGNGTPSITYHAPAQPGDYRITVTTHYGDAATELSLAAVVTVTAPRAPEPPTAAAPEAEAVASAGQAPAQQGAPAVAPEVPPVAQAEEPEASAAGAAGTQGTAAPATTDQPEPTSAPPPEVAASPGPAGDRAGPPPQEQPAPVASAAPAGEEAAPPPAAPETSAPAEAEKELPAEAPDAQVAALTETGAVAAAGSRLDRIRDRRRLTAVVQLDFKPFSFYGKDGKRTGFEIDFLHEFAKRWIGDANAVTYLPVPTDDRIPTLQKGRADLIAAALSETPQRAEQVDFSLTYFRDGQRLLVPVASDIAEVCGIQGKKVAAVEGSSSLGNIKAQAATCGFELNPVSFRRHDDAVKALLEGKVDVFTSDALALQAYAEGQPLKVVGAPFSEEAYGFAVAKGDARLLQLIDETLREMERDGTFAAIYQRWFGDAIRPSLGDAVAPVAQAALATSAPAAVEPGAGASGPGETYVVQPGDTLSKIARKYYGQKWATSWQRIFEANRDVIGEDPARLKVGMTLDIPE